MGATVDGEERPDGDAAAGLTEASEAVAGSKDREAELLTRLEYMQADFENYRKRVGKEMRELEENSSKALVTRLLGVLDGLELAVRHASEGGGLAELQEGIAMVQKNLYSALEAEGLEKIESLGRPFDPNMHEAVEKVQGAAEGQAVVVEELRTGYTFKGRVIRPTMVKVELVMKEPEQEGKETE